MGGGAWLCGPEFGKGTFCALQATERLEPAASSCPALHCLAQLCALAHSEPARRSSLFACLLVCSSSPTTRYPPTPHLHLNTWERAFSTQSCRRLSSAHLALCGDPPAPLPLSSPDASWPSSLGTLRFSTGVKLDAAITESPQGAFQNPSTMGYGDELTPEALSVPSGFDDLITSTTSQVLQAISNAMSAVGSSGCDSVLSIIHKLPEHISNMGNLGDMSGPMTFNVVSQNERVQFWLVIGYTIVVFAAILSNWVLNRVIMKYKRVHTAAGIFVVNISVTNMMLAFLSSPFTMVSWVLRWGNGGSGHEISNVTLHFQQRKLRGVKES